MENTERETAVIILAAGQGTRMKSSKAKVLHEILGKPMVMYVVETAQKIADQNVVLVVGSQAEKVRSVVSENADIIFAVQEEQLGTGHAVSCALPYLSDSTKEVIILCGDVPLITYGTLMRFFEDHVNAKRDISLLAVELDNPEGYGRILFDENRRLLGIAEEADASTEQKRINTINTGIYCVRKAFLFDSLKQVNSENVQGEFYLTDIVEIGYREGRVAGVMVGDDWEEAVGVNNPQDLIQAENILRKRIRNRS
jgi:UDP-N-acetylglucosamine diphosphorylase/glucosamine-1-phosphate N-acetyltransferase